MAFDFNIEIDLSSQERNKFQTVVAVVINSYFTNTMYAEMYCIYRFLRSIIIKHEKNAQEIQKKKCKKRNIICTGSLAVNKIVG